MPRSWILTGLALGLVIFGWTGRGRSEPQSTYATVSASTAKSPALNTELPTKWLPSKGRECIRKGPYRNFCQGPRRVPAPYGPAAELAKKLGLGDVKAVSHLLLKTPKPEWVDAAIGSEPEAEDLLWPVVGGKMWRGFGRVTRGKGRRGRHKGVDIGAADGTLIRAAKAGLVAYSDNQVRGYGNLLMLVHPDESTTLYAHCSAIYVFPGQRVERGQIVGTVGHTGIARGSHLHFEYRVRGRLRDPEKRFVGRPDL